MLKARVNSGTDEWRRRRRGRRYDGEEGSRTGVRGLECSSPVLNRLLAIVRKWRGRKRFPLDSEEVDCSWRRRENVGAFVEEVLRGAPERVAEDCRKNSASECQRQEVAFNLALGFGLLSLITASKTELDKTMELRKEMEGILRSIKEEHQSNGTTLKPSDAGVAYAASTTLDGPSNVSPFSVDDPAPSFSQPESGIGFVCDKDGDMHEKEGFLEGVDHLEEELAAELELLQLHMQTENSSENQEVGKMSSTDTTSQSVSESSGEVIDAQDNDETQYCGVPPLELERRLHELLQARQEERIKELEAHLECLKKRLHEKEAEASWWKETAKLVSKQVPESSRFLRYDFGAEI